MGSENLSKGSCAKLMLLTISRTFVLDVNGRLVFVGPEALTPILTCTDSKPIIVSLLNEQYVQS
eukprot:5684755-Amphidinium_carterae.1